MQTEAREERTNLGEALSAEWINTTTAEKIQMSKAMACSNSWTTEAATFILDDEVGPSDTQYKAIKIWEKKSYIESRYIWLKLY